jgi:uncharacterized NAD(P)/FAD-binding protein YdhS
MTTPVPVVAIIGGGFTGATVAFHLARLSPEARIVVIEPRAQLGQGLAYSTTDPSHRINVPASRMTMDCADEGGLQTWIETKGAELSPGTQIENGALFPQRRLVADYVADNLAPLLASGRVEHRQARAVAVRRGDRFEIECDDARALAADQLVIATSHPPPGIPAAFRDLAKSDRLIGDSTDVARLTRAARTAARVLVVGSGLTAADVVASLDRQGYEGALTMLSRRGQRSRGHVFGYPVSSADFAADPAVTAMDVLRDIRAAVRRDAALGLPWQAALDNVRRDGGAIWAALPLSERARLVGKLRLWWDIHRFRIAPQVAEVLDRLIAESRLRVLAGHLLSATETPAGIEISWKSRGVTRSDVFDTVILTTGPAHGDILKSSGLLGQMAAAGMVRADALALGLDVADRCHAVGHDGGVVPGLLVAGPLARGSVGELMGIPEVTAHAEGIAEAVAVELSDAASRGGGVLRSSSRVTVISPSCGRATVGE